MKKENVMKLFLTTLIALFGVVGIAQAEGGKYFTVECPKDAWMQIKKPSPPNTIQVRCLAKVAALLL